MACCLLDAMHLYVLQVDTWAQEVAEQQMKMNQQALTGKTVKHNKADFASMEQTWTHPMVLSILNHKIRRRVSCQDAA